jgi:pilus assembly protein CpaF
MFPPCSVGGAALTIRRFTRRYSLDELRQSGSLSPAACEIMRTALAHQDNIVISGGTGSGKTTFLNALAACIPPVERIILIEDTSEIHIAAPNCLRFEARRARPSLGTEPAAPAVPIAHLLLAALRHRPNRIIVGEVRGAEAFDLLQALNTGHRGSLTTIHANSAAQALARLAHCVLTAGTGLSLHAIREAIALAVQVVVHLDRIDGQRRVTEILRLQRYNARAEGFELASLFREPGASRQTHPSLPHIDVTLGQGAS